jgi:hypothetical protein
MEEMASVGEESGDTEENPECSYHTGSAFDAAGARS